MSELNSQLLALSLAHSTSTQSDEGEGSLVISSEEGGSGVSSSSSSSHVGVGESGAVGGEVVGEKEDEQEEGVKIFGEDDADASGESTATAAASGGGGGGGGARGQVEDEDEDEGDVPKLPEQMMMREDFEQNDVRIAMIGNVDSGKSTLIGVLTNATLDDGRGGARSMVLKHRHEQENGRTSAVTVEIMGYKGEEQVIASARNHSQRWTEIMERSDNSVTLIDLCGHEKYLKTTLFGLTGLVPDYCLLVVGSNMGVQVMTREHIAIACALNIPMFVAVTKVDICPEGILKQTRVTLAKLLRANGKLPFPVKDETAVQAAADSIASNRITPVFAISSVSGQGVDLLRSFVSKVRRSGARYAGMDADPEVIYERMPGKRYHEKKKETAFSTLQQHFISRASSFFPSSSFFEI